MSKSKSKTTSSQTTNQTATTTPNTPAWLQQPWQQYTGEVTDLMNNGGPIVAGPSALQQQAFAGAANLGPAQFSWQAGAKPMTAPTTGAQVMPTSAGPSAGKSLTAPTGGPEVMPTSAGPAGTQPQATGNQFGGGMGAYDLAGLLGYQAGTAGPNLATAQGYQAQGYDPALAAAANTGQAQGYDPAVLDLQQLSIDRAQVGQVGRASSRNLSQADIARTLDAAGLNDLISAQSADFDANAGMTRAGLSAAAAANGGARNSNNAIRSAVTEGELARARDTGLANTRFTAYDNAARYAMGDLDRAAQTSIANAGYATQGALAQANIDAGRNSQLAGQQFSALQGNQNAANDAGRFGADANNQFALTDAGFRQQTNLANADAMNTAGRFGADATNAANQFGAAAQNNVSQFNAGQGDNALARQLQAAGLLGSLGAQMGSDQRANIALQGDLGGIQREIENAQLSGDYARVALLGQLLGQVPSNLFVGSTETLTGTRTGTDTTSKSGFGFGWDQKNGFSFGG